MKTPTVTLHPMRSPPRWLLARTYAARRTALVLVAVFEAWEATLLWLRGFEHRNWVPLLLGLVLLLLLLAFELAEFVMARRERELCYEIADWLRPHAAPFIPGLEIAFATRPAEGVANDYFNVFQRWSANGDGEPRRVFAVMADIAGLGVHGALLMATFQASLRAFADTGMALSDLASQMNRWSWDRSLEGRNFIMAFFADVQPGTGALRYVNGGHQPPLLLRASGRAERLELRGFPLGTMEGSSYESGSTSLETGDALVLFTDGLVVAEDHRGEPFGEERLVRALEGARGLSAGDLLEVLRRAVLSFAGSSRQRDDISFMVVRRVG